VLIDLAVPRDIEPAVRSLPGIVLVDVDDLRQGLDRSLANREQAVPAVNEIIDQEIARFASAQRELSMRPLVAELRQRAERIRQQEVERTMRFLGPVDSDTREHIQHLSRALVNKLLHEPTVRIKELAHNNEADLYVSALCDIFGLETAISVVSQHEHAETRGESSCSI
jgi:glutamyl-tRNA reductase